MPFTRTALRLSVVEPQRNSECRRQLYKIMTDSYIGSVKIIQPEDAESRVFSDEAEVKEILRILKEEPPEEFSALINEKKAWPFLLHLSHVRTNVIRSLTFSQTESVLEIGAGCGTLTGFLAERCGAVTGIDPSLQRCRVNAERNSRHDNITLLAMTAAEAGAVLSNAFDTVLWIDAPVDASEDEGLRMTAEKKLQFSLAHLKPGGRLILATDNRLGMRFLAGEKEEYTARFFEGLEGYPSEEQAYTASKKEWGQFLAESGLEDTVWYYPYPDHRFAMQIYSDAWLPKAEDLHINYQNFARKRMALFDDDAVWRSLLENDLFPQFANSYLIVCRKGRS